MASSSSFSSRTVAVAFSARSSSRLLGDLLPAPDRTVTPPLQLVSRLADLALQLLLGVAAQQRLGLALEP